MVKHRLLFIDIAKAIGIFLVVLAHTFRGVSHQIIVPNYYYLNIFDSIIYTFHMPLFFLISGIFFYESLQNKGLKSFVWSKVDSIVYPYLLWRFIQGVPMVMLSTSGVINNTLSVEYLLSIWKPTFQFWFLYDLFFMLVITAILVKFFSIRIIKWLLVISVGLYVFQLEVKELHIILLGSLAKNYVFFILGVFLSLSIKQHFTMSRLWLALLTVACIFSQYYFHFVLHLDWENTGVLSLLLAVLAIALVVYVSWKICPSAPNFMTMVGQQSMAIYLMHIIFAAIMRITLLKLSVDDFYIHIILGTLFGLLAPIGLVKLCEKIGFNYLTYFPISKIKLRSKSTI